MVRSPERAAIVARRRQIVQGSAPVADRVTAPARDGVVTILNPDADACGRRSISALENPRSC
jgi:hypothetical protein